MRRLLMFTFALPALTMALAAAGVRASAQSGRPFMPKWHRAPSATAPHGTPTATTFHGISTVAALFRGPVSAGHSCSASVIASPHHDLVLTAAHCVRGTAAGWHIAPGYHRGATPYGVWTVVAAYVPPGWRSSQNPQYDYAILRMARQRWGGRSDAIQDVTGANALGTAPRTGWTITDVAYNAGAGDDPLRCTTRAYYTGSYPSFDCHGFVGGSSGSPWLYGNRVVGVIGGLHQGGCSEQTSYSSRFAADVAALAERAERNEAGDVAPAPGADGC